MPLQSLTLGTRASALALAQTGHVVEAIRPFFSGEIRVKPITTSGDRDQVSHYKNSSSSLKSFFTKEIEAALLSGEVDAAVHSLKDLPTELPPGLDVVSYLPRQDARDVFLSQRYRSLSECPKGAIIGTASARRAFQLSLYAPHVVASPIRGNIDTRIRKMSEGECDGIIIAQAAVMRLEAEVPFSEILSLDSFVPSPGQAIIALEMRSSADPVVLNLAKQISSPESALQAQVERGVSAAFGGGCHLPLGAYVSLSQEELTVYVQALLHGNNIKKIFHFSRLLDTSEIISSVVEGLGYGKV